MYDYGEACPISKASSVLGERWTLQIIREMMLGARRFSDFQRYMPKISPSLLNTRLRTLEQHGIILRKRIPEHKGHEYLLTPAGKALKPLMIELGRWGMRWAFEDLADDELSAVAILRDIAIKLNADELPAGDCIMQFTLTDLQESPTRYIIFSEGKGRECDQNPGHEVDLYFKTTLRTLTEIWFGKTDLVTACHSGALSVVGPPAYTRRLSRWFPISDLARERQ